MQVASAYLKNGGKLALENEYTERIREFIKGEWKLKLSVIKSPPVLLLLAFLISPEKTRPRVAS